jgi:hypothetical protein
MTPTENRTHDLDRDDQLAAVDLMQTGPRLRRLVWSSAFALIAIVAVGCLCWVVMSPGDEYYIPTANAGAWRAMGFFAGAAGFVTFTVSNWWMKRAHDRATPPVPTAALRKS